MPTLESLYRTLNLKRVAAKKRFKVSYHDFIVQVCRRTVSASPLDSGVNCLSRGRGKQQVLIVPGQESPTHQATLEPKFLDQLPRKLRPGVTTAQPRRQGHAGGHSFAQIGYSRKIHAFGDGRAKLLRDCGVILRCKAAPRTKHSLSGVLDRALEEP